MLIELLIILIVTAAILFYRYANRHSQYFVQRGIPYLRPTFLLGNTGPFIFQRQRPNEFHREMYAAMPQHKAFGFYLFCTPLFFVSDPQMIKRITIRDFDHFVDHQSFLESVSDDDVIGQTLLTMTGDKWRQMRAILSPTFTGSKMRQMFGLVSDSAADMCTALRAQSAASGGDALRTLDMKELFSKYTNDVIATTAFGVSVNSFRDPENPFLRNGQRMMNPSVSKMMLKYAFMKVFPWLTRRLEMQLADGPAIAFFKHVVTDQMRHRQSHGIVRPDVIDLLMRVRRGEDLSTPEDGNNAVEADETSTTNKPTKKKESWTDNEILSQCLLFFLAGFETTATALSTLAYELACNPDVQERLYDECAEIRDRLHGTANSDGIARSASLPYDVLQQMPYLDGVVCESLRMWPPAMMTERACVKDYAYDDGELRFQIPAHTSVWIPIYALHHDEKYFADAQRFDPERFSAERRASIVPGTYVPFGQGPRNCIASRFAIMEMKAAIYHMVLNFRFETCEKTQIPLQLAKTSGAFRTEKGIHIALKVRIE